MTEEILFSEKQKFKQWWLWIILLGINVRFLWGAFNQIMHGQQFGDKPISNIGLLLITGLTIFITILFLILRLETIIKSDGIYVRYFPFHLKFKQYQWDSLNKSYVRKYSAIVEYGGWGLRIGLFGKGKAYNVSGNRGLQLEFKSGKKLLIGTNKSEELLALLHQIGQLNE